MIRTVLCIKQHLKEIGLVVLKGLSDFVYSLLIGQVTIHEAAERETGQESALCG